MNSHFFNSNKFVNYLRYIVVCLIYLLRIYTVDIRRIYFLNSLKLVLITILKIFCTKIVIFNPPLGLLRFYNVFILPTCRVFSKYFDVKEELSCLAICIYCMYSLSCIIRPDDGQSLGIN